MWKKKEHEGGIYFLTSRPELEFDLVSGTFCENGKKVARPALSDAEKNDLALLITLWRLQWSH